MVNEILDVLKIQPGEQGLDATLGYGGHTRAMLERLEGKGHIYALDVDPIEIKKTKERLASQGYEENILTVRQINFAEIDRVAEEAGRFDFVLADLGVSSMQIDNPDRGFSYKVDGPLDLRMNPEKGVSAAERLKTVSEEELRGMLEENADEPYAEEIAQTIWKWEKRGRVIETTTQLKEAIEALADIISGVQQLRVEIVPVGTRTHHILLEGKFDSLEALQQYQVHPAHVSVAQRLQQVAGNRACFDYEG